MKKTYKVGEHYFSLKTESSSIVSLLEDMNNYMPFIVEYDERISTVFELEIEEKETVKHLVDKTVQLAEFDDDIAYISVMQRVDDDYTFLIALNKLLKDNGGLLEVNKNMKSASLYLTYSSDKHHKHFIINNALMLLYALFTSTLSTLLIHASVVVNNGKGYAFLGRSGTGKSTHTRLWLKHIEGSSLLNDDNPVIRIHSDGRIMIYGSPWSGKTPCYINEGVELKSIVRLSQAPYNKIVRLNNVFAYAAISPSASCMKWDRVMTDSLHESFSEIIKNIGIYHLECLPDEEASKLCFEKIK